MALAKPTTESMEKEPLADLVPTDCVAINEIIEYADLLAEKEKKEGYEKFGDAAKGRTHLSRMLSSIVTGKLEKGCSWFDFSADSAWIAEGRIDELSLRIFKAAELFSKHKYPGKALPFHDAFACMVVAATTDHDIAQKVQLVRRSVMDRGVLNPQLHENHEISLTSLDYINKRIEERI